MPHHPTLLRTLRLACPAALLVLAGCAGTPNGPAAVADLAPTRGNIVTGSVRFVQMGDVVRVTGTVRGLPPNTVHGFHIHEKGDCSGGEGMAAGGHFNPGGTPHGRFGDSASHAGELPDLRADATGTATFTADARALRVGSGEADIIGRGLIVHRDPDDHVTQPTGNSGPRLACAAIVRS